ncbi:hypothetical protein J1N35_003765 [Gossypium stocksii]|uniref:Uncharacterized protein n=1 Tax=Gossypium stocksii TaxID=47602 RepID=A0A9D4AHL8_9ROSI|nr:hypothetical protein J1N35_003765 [Gossypium stocksii]
MVILASPRSERRPPNKNLMTENGGADNAHKLATWRTKLKEQAFCLWGRETILLVAFPSLPSEQAHLRYHSCRVGQPTEVMQ